MVEHEILRIAATVLGADPAEAAEAARREVLAWAQNRSGGKLPPEAWALEKFEHMSGGRNSAGVRLRSEESDIWAIRADDPDKTVPGRIWTHEVVVGLMGDQPPRFSVRQLVSTPEPELIVEPHAPGFMQQVVERCGLLRPTYDLSLEPWLIRRDEEMEDLLEDLVYPMRSNPVFVLTVPDDAANPELPLVDAVGLSRATLGLARVVIVPARHTAMLTSAFGRKRSVFGGAARAYLPGFSADANPYAHRLILASDLISPEGKIRVGRWMRSIAATESLRALKLGRDVLAFAGIRNASLRVTQERLSSEGAGEAEQLSIAHARIAALEADLKTAEDYQAYFDGEATKERERAEAAEAQHRASAYRIQLLEEAAKAEGRTNVSLELPAGWSEFSTWCDVELAGRLALASAARRGVKQPEFEDSALVARCLIWLATTYRDGRISGAAGDFRDVYIEPGIRNSPCGGDEFDFDWQGRRQTAEWHIKTGGNTRDPKRALRIYYCWDEETQQIVVADMPAHRPSAAS